MNYNEIIGLHDYFQPVFDLEEEHGSYWKQFIPNEKFYNVLSSTLNAFTSSEPKDIASLWMQGTYGTGKSHATGVIKHLLYDDIDEIRDFIGNLENEQLKFKLENFRSNKKVFPVVLKGTSFIFDNRTFSLVIEHAVKNALRKRDIFLTLKSDFDRMIEKLRSNELNWSEIFNNTELGVYNNTDVLIKKLEHEDIEIFRKIENILSQKGYHFSVEKITDWLKDVRNQLKDKNIADYIIFYWDEFTGIFELEKSGIILTELQSIAELTRDYGIYLFIVSHRTPHQTNISKSDMEKVLGRFIELDYSMEPITTYHIVNAAINKTNKEEWEKQKNNNILKVQDVIDEIVGSEGLQVKNSLKNLFPIHPYTSYIMTFISRNIGSTNRSIFEFLYDDIKGFKKFIEENPELNGKIFLGLDYLWDYFYEIFNTTENEKILAVIEKFKLHSIKVAFKGDNYLSVFKGILLLNILHRVAELGESSFVAPSYDNILKSFKGIIKTDELNNILTFINNNQIISKTPDNLFLITGTGIYQNVAEEKESLKGSYSEIQKILGDAKEQLEKNISSNVNREVEILIVDGNLTEHILRRKLDNDFKKNFTIKAVLIISKDEREINYITDIIREISIEDNFKNIIFLVLDAIFDEANYSKFLEYKAMASLAAKHNNSDERKQFEDYANKIVTTWVQEVISSSYVEWFLNDKNSRELFKKISKKIQDDLVKNIFEFGFDILKESTKNKNIWTPKKAKAAAENFLFPANRAQLEEKTSRGIEKFLRSILKDNNDNYIVDQNLNFKEGFDDHPLKKIYLKVRETLDSKQQSFNLGETLEFITKPPFGIYANMIHFAAIGFIMREYVGKFYEVGSGIPIQQNEMRDKILYLFEAWEQDRNVNKLHLRIGTREEEELIEVLKYIFDFRSEEEENNLKSFNKVRWKIREWIKDKKFPLWVYKYNATTNDACQKAIDTIYELTTSIDTDITIEKIKSYKEDVDTARIELYFLFRKNIEDDFLNWLKSIDNVEFEDDEFDDIINYLNKKLQEEIASWTEDKVREKVKDWYLEKINKEYNIFPNTFNILDSNPLIRFSIQPKPMATPKVYLKEKLLPIKDIDNNRYEIELKNLAQGDYILNLVIDDNTYQIVVKIERKDIIPPEEIDVLINKIKKIQDIGKFKTIIIELIEERPDLINIIKKKVEGHHD